MNLYLLTFFFIQYLFSFATNTACDLSKVINEILVAKTSKKYMFFYYCSLQSIMHSFKMCITTFTLNSFIVKSPTNCI